MAVADSFLSHGIAGGFGAGAGLHVVVRGFHPADLSARGRGARESTRMSMPRRYDLFQPQEPAGKKGEESFAEKLNFSRLMKKVKEREML
jgi:hypothetical protein